MKENILSWMYKLASVPRGSHHEEAVSHLLKNEIEALGFSAVQDDALNIIADIPATPGKEAAPCVILQAHMDMVIAVREGEHFDPLSDTPVLYEDNGVLSSRGVTSIGADDGIGIALAMAIVTSDVPHGPLRLIFTADEEDGMTGATHIDEKWLDADYLVNLDWEAFGSVCNSCAGCRGYAITYQPTYTQIQSGTTICLQARGFRGGHSGITIGEGRDNAILVLLHILLKLHENNVDFRLVAMEGGSARNAIPSYANVQIHVDTDADRVVHLIEQWKKEAYKEENAVISAFVADTAKKAASIADTKALLGFATTVPNGVYSMSAVMDGLVECSSNLGLIALDASQWFIDIFARSSSYEKEEELEAQILQTTKSYGWALSVNQSAPGWPVNAESRILPVLLSVYEELYHKPMIVEPVHAGLECGWFVIKNKFLDCVSFGPTLHEVHTPNEALDIDSAVGCFILLKNLLERI